MGRHYHVPREDRAEENQPADEKDSPGEGARIAQEANDSRRQSASHQEGDGNAQGNREVSRP
jgi:hypothetical protein